MSRQPFTSFIMLGAMRSGSNLLEKFLNQYEGLVCHGELFHKSFIGVQGCQKFLGIETEARNEDPQRLLDAVRANTPHKITGYRFFQDHDEKVMEAALKDRYCAKIILTRDPVESFVSLQIALETQQWLVSDIAHRKDVQIHFDLEEYATYLKDRTAFYGRISQSLTTSEQPYFEIDYEMLTDVNNINRLAAFIGDRAGKAVLEEPIKRQNPGALAHKISNIQEVR
ncbi:MAG: nodulation protein NodH, partial [Rhodobacteraceae bacterium]|nr:nodulation protein NodH [Paracoccaceae bacterium]